MIALLAAALLCVPPTIPNVDVRLVQSVIANESGYNRLATSRTGAQGLMQIMPATGRALGLCNAYDATENIAAGTTYLAELLARFHGNVKLAIAAYNAGAGAVEKYGGIPPYVETRSYVARVLRDYAGAPVDAPRPHVSPQPVPTWPGFGQWHTTLGAKR